MIFPWQNKQWQLIWEAKHKNRFPHALLFVGGCDLEKKHFAEELSAAILCEKLADIQQACGTCHACHMTVAKSHPDLIMIEPEQTGGVIKVDQIRGLIQQANETAMQGGFRVIIISPAHAMNIAASNALLKTLEEPVAKTLLMLVSNQPFRLPATITSRCQKIVFQKPSYEMALQWLQHQESANPDVSLLLDIAEGFPLQALAGMKEDIILLRQELYQGLFILARGEGDPLALAAKWQEYDMQQLFKLWLAWLRDLMRFKLINQVELLNKDYSKDFAKLKLSRENLLNYLEMVQSSYKKVVNLQNLNKQLLLEELLIRWTGYVSC